MSEPTNTEITSYNDAQSPTDKAVCQALHASIGNALPGATSKLYHGSPVWFIADNPIVGYDVNAKGVNVLFWSGQSFVTNGLKPAGKYQAAGLTFRSLQELEDSNMADWLAESPTVQWNYRDLRANNGRLERL